MRMAAIQMNALLGDVASNLAQAEKYIQQAVLAEAELDLLPEFFTSAIGFSEKMLDVPSENERVRDVLLRWSSMYRIVIGGSYVAFDGEDAFNLFELVFPNGDVFEHKKDIPTQFENSYYANGDNNNVLITPIGNVGIALCWEMIRYDTLRRMDGKADFVLAGSCWWDLPEDAGSEREELRRYNQNLALETPVTFARLLGVPLVHANHCGKVTACRFPMADKIQTRQLVGGAQIIGGGGRVIQRKEFSEGAGFVISDIPLKSEARQKSDYFPPDYWIPDLPESYRNAWNTINPLAKQYYQTTALPHYKRQYKKQ